MRLSDRAEMLIPPLPWDRRAHQASLQNPVGKVVLLHGLGRSWRAMNPLARELQHHGFSTLNLPYPSLIKPLDWILDHADRQIGCFAGDEPVHFVTHSLGGIITRKLLARSPSWKPGRLVMLAPPSSGSEIIDWASRRPILKRFLSPAARSLASDILPSHLPALAPGTEAIVIMGSRCSIPFFKPLLDPENDGIVSVNRGHVAGLRGFHVVDADHTFIQLHPEAVRQTIGFLKSGACAAVSG